MENKHKGKITVPQMKKEARAKCQSYGGKCMKADGRGIVDICPLRGDNRSCHALLCTDLEVADAYDKMFKKGIR